MQRVNKAIIAVLRGLERGERGSRLWHFRVRPTNNLALALVIVYSRLLTIYSQRAENNTMPARIRAAPSSPAPSTTAIALLRTHSLATLAHHELERMILSGDLPAGGKL